MAVKIPATAQMHPKSLWPYIHTPTLENVAALPTAQGNSEQVCLHDGS
jgi:hypothetical protein